VSTTSAYRECFLYVDADGFEQISGELAERLGTPSRFDRFRTDGFEVEVVRNGLRLPDRPDTFVDWSTKVEVYADAAPDDEVVRFVTDLMGFLRSKHHRVVAACDFEDQLPQTDLD
jgi:hypothetical protein